MASSPSPAEPLRGHAREAALGIAEAEIDQLHQLARAAHQYRNKVLWRRLRQRRRSTVWVVISTVQQMLVGATRERTAEGWQFHSLTPDGTRVPAVVLLYAPASSFTDMIEPLQVQVIDHGFVDVAELQHRLRHRGVRVT